MLPEWEPDVTLPALTSALGLLIGFDVRCNQDFELFIARLADADAAASLRLSLSQCEERTEHLSLLYHIVRAMDEATLRALYARARAELQRGKAA